MTDWTTARVVRDRAGHAIAVAGITAMHLTGPRAGTRIHADRLPEFGPLVPVLDADGLPVVRTVGDLTARHIGREVHVEGMRRAVLLAMRQPLPDEQLIALLVRVDGDITSTDYLTIDTPCELVAYFLRDAEAVR